MNIDMNHKFEVSREFFFGSLQLSQRAFKGFLKAVNISLDEDNCLIKDNEELDMNTYLRIIFESENEVVNIHLKELEEVGFIAIKDDSLLVNKEVIKRYENGGLDFGLGEDFMFRCLGLSIKATKGFISLIAEYMNKNNALVRRDVLLNESYLAYVFESCKSTSNKYLKELKEEGFISTVITKAGECMFVNPIIISKSTVSKDILDIFNDYYIESENILVKDKNWDYI